jgi:hypothetical protein
MRVWIVPSNYAIVLRRYLTSADNTWSEHQIWERRIVQATEPREIDDKSNFLMNRK